MTQDVRGQHLEPDWRITVSSARDDYFRYLWPPFTQVGDLDEDEPLIATGAKGATVFDEKGRQYIDAHGALWVSNVGWGRDEIADAVYQQMKKLAWFPSFESMTTDTTLALARRLVKMMEPEGMAKVFFSSGGSEAVETALKIARQYWRLKGRSGKYKIIARRGAYHGVTLGALSAGGIAGNRTYFEPLVPGFSHIEAPYCYRCPFGLEHPGCHLRCAEDLERAIRFEGSGSVAAFIGEPVMGAGGVLIPPDGYWQRIQEICRRHDVLLLVDEVMTGFGRTGKISASRHWDLSPDIMIFAKALTSGYQPLGATLVTEEIFNAYLGKHEDNRHFPHGNTYSGHPVACAAGLVNLDITEKEDLPGRSARLGEYLLKGLRELEDLPVVGDVAGLGLLARVEMVACRETRKPFDPGQSVGRRVSKDLQRKGVVLRPLGDVLTVSPPLVIKEEEIDRLLETLREVLADYC